MKFIARIRADLERSLAEQQRAAVLAVLKARLGELTLDDVHQLLASPLGRGLGAVRILDLLDAGATSRHPAAATRTRRKTTRPKSVTGKRGGKPKASRVSTTSATLLDGIVRVLGDAETPLRRGELARRLGVPPKRLWRPLHELVYVGTITAAGTRQRLYSLPTTRKTTETPPAEAPRSKKRSSSKTKPRKRKSRNGTKPRGQSQEKLAALARYGASLLAAMKEAGRWVGSAELRAQVGGTSSQFRRAIKKLEASGDIVRQGDKGQTQFATAGTPTTLGL